MIRKIIQIDQDKCNGCGLCVEACHEGAIQMIDGKARLVRDDYCDGLGDCLPSCPVEAISFVTREALPYNEEEVKKNMAHKHEGHSCPSSKPLTLNKQHEHSCPSSVSRIVNKEENHQNVSFNMKSELTTWPIQIKLAPINASYFDNANLLIAADCTAFSYGNFHEEFIKNHVTIIGCPKLDMVDYKDKLKAIIQNNNIKSVKIVRMEVPCCSKLAQASKEALQESGKFIPWQIVTISIDGKILD